ncbi:carbohydrate ABC transporter permease [Mesorhizobium sp. M00.F.Ca.ET.151.01.1.1]|nr:carbohydrate ABC transporter permease [Mesorhizobium sp. M00.F.Ca.ET.151.01.1.1]
MITKMRKLERYGGRLFVYGCLAVLATLYLVPLWVMLITSFKPLDEIYSGSLIGLPKQFTFEAWSKAWSTACIGTNCVGLSPFFLNSLIITVPAVFVSTAIGAINGYTLAKWKFRGSDLFFAFMLFGCFLPLQAVLLPIARVLGMLRLSGSTAGLILVHTVYGIAFTTMFFRNYFVSFPDELTKAALVDGAGFFRIFFSIALPTAVPIAVVCCIWQFTSIWNDFLFGVSFSAGGSSPITVALNNVVNVTLGRKQYNVDMAAALIAALPTLIVYVLSGRYFVRGLTAGAVKG